MFVMPRAFGDMSTSSAGNNYPMLQASCQERMWAGAS